jgi:mannose/fructose/N-acetylgalactosamine-specific phosphotransferase system component IIB
MAVVLLRIDERLIHGQVVVGWRSLRAGRIAVVDDDLALSSWEQELYVLGLPPELQTEFLTVADARQRVPDWIAGEERVVVLTRNVASMRRLAEGGLLEGQDVNIGGIHHAEGRRKVLPYVFLGAAEREEMRRLARQGVSVSARDLPHSRAVGLNELLSNTDAAEASDS